jgi:hypothetical protein
MQKKLFNSDGPKASFLDDRYNKYCCICNRKLVEFDREWNGIDRPTIGRLIYEEKGWTKITGFHFCIFCKKEIITQIEDIVEKKQTLTIKKT